MTALPLIVPLADAQDVTLVGGKAINLYRLMQAGLPVPDGFVVTTAAFRKAGVTSTMPKTVAGLIQQAYKILGEPTVAVRSSATAEDLAGASMAGQYDTFLDVTGSDAVVVAVQKCWQSLQAKRVQAYLKEQGIDPNDVAVAVVVQQLVPAEVSGVLFTANPRTGALNEMIIEAVYGLGEGIVSGETQPDVYHVHADEGQVLDLHIAHKTKALRPGDPQYQTVPETQATKACLNYAQLQTLRHLGQQAQQHFGSPQDMEWALVNGHIHVLQARAITTLAETQAYHALLDETRTFLEAELSQGRGPWVRHNLSETLPLPSPLTWSLIQPFMSGSGGFGRMHQRVGFKPSDAIRENGFLTLIAGQIYMDCTRLPEMFCPDYPYAYDLEQLRHNPDAAQQPPTVRHGTYKQLAVAARLGADVTKELRCLALTLDTAFDSQFVPRVTAWCEVQAGQALTTLPDEDLMALWQAQQKTVLDDFGAMAFLPSMVEALAATDLKAFLTEHLWDDDPEAIMQQLSVSPVIDVTLQSNIALQEVVQGQRTWESWLHDYGFRGPGEFDLACPRWTERREELHNMASQLADAPAVSKRHYQRVSEAEQCLAQLKQQLDTSLATDLETHVTLLQRYVRFREDGKAVFMRAFAQLRRTVWEFGRRLQLDEAVFFLYADELSTALQQGFVPQDRITQRQHRQQAVQKLCLPHVIEARDIPSLGEPQVPDDSDCWPAFPVASGSCTGPARIVLDPTQAHDLGKSYVLICPSTDPAWTPLFVKAAGLILERGGALSHGAIVAREMGLPAVVLENATTLFKESETLSINGNQGQITRSSHTPVRDTATPDPDDSHITYAQRPPIVGKKEQRVNQQGLIAALIWGTLLGTVYLLPAPWLKEPVFTAIDILLWPLVRLFGMVWTVALVGTFFALVPLIIQRCATDNTRLWEAKKRAARLQKTAADFPQGSIRRKAMLDCAAPVTMRTLKASMAALAWVIGPMMLVFLWMPERLDPAAWNADPGGLVTVVAELDGEYQTPMTCAVAAPLTLEGTTPSTQTLPPIRATLEDLRREWQQTGDLSDYPWQLQTAGDQAQEILLTSLHTYLAAGVPPQKLTWMIRVPENADGHYPVTINLPDQPTHELMLAFGNQKPPTPNTLNIDYSPLIQIEAIYPRPLQQRRFWTPLKAMGGPTWDFGWLGVYILSYLLVMLIVKRFLHVS